MKFRKFVFLQILLCFSIFTSIPISAVDYAHTYQFLDEWRLVVVDEKGVNVTMSGKYVSSIHIVNSTDGLIEAEMIHQNHVGFYVWNLFQSHVGDYLIDSSRFGYLYAHWLETHPNSSENPNIDVLESSAVDCRFIYSTNHRNVQINFMGDVGKLYTVTGNRSSYVEFIYDEDGVLLLRKQQMIFENDSQLLLEEYYMLQRISNDVVKTSETNFSPLSLMISSLFVVLLIIRKKIKQRITKFTIKTPK